ncbi:MAG: nucleotidyltransferase domain-containing protein [Nanoarchaeota archaeon]|nr:nucleotidyltransferase domain-containing protein [Nanoarchaeota archaeon]
MNQLLQFYNLLKVLNVFFDDPIKDFQLREISRKIKLHHKSVLIYIKQLLKSGLIKINKKTLYKSYNANTENPMFQRYKKTINQIKLYESGLIEYLYEGLMPKCIVVFGGYAKGTDTKNSDIDIFVEIKEEKIDVTKFEEKLGRKIHLLFEKDIKHLNEGLKNNIMNGIVLSGNLRLLNGN